MTENTAAATGGPATIRIAGEDRLVERASARKGSAAFGLIRAISGKVPELVTAWGKFNADYEASHVTEVDRPMALMRYGPRPVTDGAGVPLVYPATVGAGDDEKPHPLAGELVVLPSPLDGMTEEAWSAAGGVMRLPRSPSLGESIAAIFPDALEVAEDHVYRLLALALMPNEEVKRRRKDGSIKEELAEQADNLVDDAMLDELLELAVVFGEVIDEQIRSKLTALEGRVGNALRLVGMDPSRWAPQTAAETPQTPDSGGTSSAETPPADGKGTPPPSTPSSSPDTPESSDGPPTPPSTPPPTSSPPLAVVSSSSGQS